MQFIQDLKNTRIHIECDSKIRAPILQKMLMPPITKRRQEEMQQRGPMPDVATLGAAAFGKEKVFIDS